MEIITGAKVFEAKQLYQVRSYLYWIYNFMFFSCLSFSFQSTVNHPPYADFKLLLDRFFTNANYIFMFIAHR